MPETPLSPKQDESRWWMRILAGARQSNAYPIVIGFLAAISAGSGLYPFGPVLVAAILIAPRRWLWIYLTACIGAVAGVLALAGLVEFYGLSAVNSMFPGLEQRSDWLRYTHWISRYGWVALLAFAALPIPQMPVLLLSALSHISLAKIAVAVFVGKLIKYGAYEVITLAALKGIQEPK